jgi:hypothetical protein
MYLSVCLLMLLPLIAFDSSLLQIAYVINLDMAYSTSLAARRFLGLGSYFCWESSMRGHFPLLLTLPRFANTLNPCPACSHPCSQHLQAQRSVLCTLQSRISAPALCSLLVSCSISVRRQRTCAQTSLACGRRISTYMSNVLCCLVVRVPKRSRPGVGAVTSWSWKQWQGEHEVMSAVQVL